LKTIVLFTASYPYSIAVENTFLEEELYYLNRYFKVIIIPQTKKGERSEFVNNLNNVEVWEDLEEFKKQYVFKVFDLNLIKELKNIKTISHLKNLLIHYAKTKWLQNYLENKFNKNLLKSDFIYYTFWFDTSTTALIYLKKKYNFKVFSRVHGGDLYFERNNGYIPFRKSNIEIIDKIVAVSKQAYNYLENRYKLSKDKIELFHLLSKDYKVINPLNKDKKFKVVSCALVSPLKRIDEIIRLLYKFTKQYNIKVEYTHIGNGIDFEKIKKLSKQYSNEQYKINLLGFKNIDEIMKIYKNQSFDIFITLSKTEGGVPFALREAASCEIPLIGTKVGGIPEIIKDNYNGFLIDKDYNDKDVIDILYKMYNLKFANDYEKFRKRSRKIFLDKFEANKNHKKFVEFLEGL